MTIGRRMNLPDRKLLAFEQLVGRRRSADHHSLLPSSSAVSRNPPAAGHKWLVACRSLYGFDHVRPYLAYRSQRSADRR